MVKAALSALVLSALLAPLPASAQGRTCSGRDQVCREECVRNYRNSTQCNRTCDGRKSDCMSTGCWGKTNQCGYQRS
ncbi:hypothetical protein [Enterovirga aerilata]|uniref:Uncharacterized protein n=1 Tax=Enterovirga aerilata TaxID=2730920 RepID=A0A849I7X5_9HYPH|nr:hypothetical protein [Enterovirga sp. DB1703]NNM73488.1 hypothetical protein [Enterovirga sp. DB1703]